LKAAGRAYVLTTMSTTFTPSAAKARRALLRAGCVEAVIALPSKMLQHTAIPTALWVLQAADFSARDSVMMVDASSADPSAELARWAHTPPAQSASPGPERVTSAVVDIEDLISDDDATLNPQRWAETYSDTNEIAGRHHRASGEFAAALALLEDLSLQPAQSEFPQSHVVAVRQLEAQGVLRVLTKGRASAAAIDDEAPTDPRVVTTRMVRDGLPPLPQDAVSEAGADATSSGDVLVTTMRTIRAVVDTSGGRILRPGVIRIWLDPSQFDPQYVAACLCAGWNQRFQHGTVITHASIKDLQIPLIPLSAQRQVADDVQRLHRIDENARRVSAASGELAATLLDAVRFNIDLQSNTTR
jgi:hypothetical protein